MDFIYVKGVVILRIRFIYDSSRALTVAKNKSLFF